MTNFDPYSRLIFLDNEYHVSQSPNQHKVLNPANLNHEGTIALCSTQEVEQVISRAKEAQQEWKREDEKNRARILHQIASSIEDGDLSEVAKLMVLEALFRFYVFNYPLRDCFDSNATSRMATPKHKYFRKQVGGHVRCLFK